MTKFTSKLRDMNDAELKGTLKKLRAEQMRAEVAFHGTSNIRGTPSGKFTGEVSANVMALKDIKKCIARCLTIIKERELAKELRR